MARLRRDHGASGLLLCAILGMGISVYLTAVHYADAAPVCSAAGGVVDCAAVTRSSWSVVPGTAIPVTVLGMLWFLGSAALTVRDHPGALLAWCGAGMAAVLYFVYAELVALHRICEWCSAVHLLVVASSLIALVRFLPDPEHGAEQENAGTV